MQKSNFYDRTGPSFLNKFAQNEGPLRSALKLPYENRPECSSIPGKRVYNKYIGKGEIISRQGWIL